MHEHEVQVEYRNNRPEFKRRLKEEYNLPSDDAVVEAMLESAAICLDRGLDEAEPLAAKYKDLMCPWCGRLHYRKECMEAMAKANASKE